MQGVVPGVRNSDFKGTVTNSQISALALCSGTALGKLQNYFGSLFLIYKMGVTAIGFGGSVITHVGKYFMNGGAVPSGSAPCSLKSSNQQPHSGRALILLSKVHLNFQGPDPLSLFF